MAVPLLNLVFKNKYIRRKPNNVEPNAEPDFFEVFFEIFFKGMSRSFRNYGIQSLRRSGPGKGVLKILLVWKIPSINKFHLKKTLALHTRTSKMNVEQRSLFKVRCSMLGTFRSFPHLSASSWACTPVRPAPPSCPAWSRSSVPVVPRGPWSRCAARLCGASRWGQRATRPGLREKTRRDTYVRRWLEEAIGRFDSLKLLWGRLHNSYSLNKIMASPKSSPRAETKNLIFTAYGWSFGVFPRAT